MKQPLILLLSLFLPASCQMRYRHVQKVKKYPDHAEHKTETQKLEREDPVHSLMDTLAPIAENALPLAFPGPDSEPAKVPEQLTEKVKPKPVKPKDPFTPEEKNDNHSTEDPPEKKLHWIWLVLAFLLVEGLYVVLVLALMSVIVYGLFGVIAMDLVYLILGLAFVLAVLAFFLYRFILRRVLKPKLNPERFKPLTGGMAIGLVLGNLALVIIGSVVGVLVLFVGIFIFIQCHKRL